MRYAAHCFTMRLAIVGIIAMMLMPLGSAALTTHRPVVVIDTDMLSDDWVALVHLAARVDLRAVTIAATGATHCEPGRHNARYLLQLALGSRRGANIPVACGPDRPLDGFVTFPLPFRLEAAAMPKLAGYRPDRQPIPPGDAADILYRALDASPQPVTVIALGPLTNVALLLRRYPQARPRIKRLYVMGGAVDVPGNIVMPGITDHLHNTQAEWNFYADPVAVREVLHSGVPVYLLPLDATRQVPLTSAFVGSLGDVDDAARSPVARLITAAHRQLADGIGSGRFYFWDALAAVSVTAPRVCRFVPLHADIAIRYRDPACHSLPGRRCAFDEARTGQLVKSPSAPRLHYCRHVDTALFYPTIRKTFVE